MLTAIAASTLIASRSLYCHVRDVAAALETGGLEAGRAAVSRIVGRDPQTLDSAGVARAAIESLAENASDGVAAPVFWFALLGLPGLAAYKAINTADSMIGHRTPRHEAFGWASARLDDLVNLPASRLTAALFALAALLHKASARGALQAVLRDARRHRSPNAGWPEAAMAGALGLRLAGPRCYGGVVVPDAYMGPAAPAPPPPISAAQWCSPPPPGSPCSARLPFALTSSREPEQRLHINVRREMRRKLVQRLLDQGLVGISRPLHLCPLSLQARLCELAT